MTARDRRVTGKRPGETGFALLLLILSLAGLGMSWRMASGGGLSGPGVFPLLASGAMATSAAVILVRSFGGGMAAPGAVLAYLAPARLVLFLGLLAAYAVAVPRLGFMVASALFLFAAIWMLWRRGPLASLAVTALAMAAIYAVFRLVFAIVLPTGSLWS